MKTKWEVNGYSIVQCSQCRLTFVNPQPSAETLKEFYSSTYFFGSKDKQFGYADYGKHDQENSKRGEENAKLYTYALDHFEKLVNTGKLLEIGGAFGGFLSAAKQRGWDVVGVEKSLYCCSVMQKQGIESVHGDVWDAGFERESFDAVYCSMAIEHFTDPAKVVKHVKMILRRNGVFMVRTVDIGSFNAISKNLVHKITGRHLWSEIKPPEHLFFFSKKTLSRLLEQRGFKTHVFPEFDQGTYASVKFSNPVLKAISVILKPVLHMIPAGSAMTVVGIKPT